MFFLPIYASRTSLKTLGAREAVYHSDVSMSMIIVKKLISILKQISAYAAGPTLQQHPLTQRNRFPDSRYSTNIAISQNLHLLLPTATQTENLSMRWVEKRLCGFLAPASRPPNALRTQWRTVSGPFSQSNPVDFGPKISCVLLRASRI